MTKEEAIQALKEGKSSKDFDVEWEEDKETTHCMLEILSSAMDEHATSEVNRVMGELIEWMEDAKEYKHEFLQNGINMCIKQAKSLISGDTAGEVNKQ